jgi:hypothetical protein
LIIWHLRGVVPREVLLFTRNITSSMKQADLRDIFTRPSRVPVHNYCDFCSPLVSYCVNFFTYEDPRNTEDDAASRGKKCPNRILL